MAGAGMEEPQWETGLNKMMRCCRLLKALPEI